MKGGELPSLLVDLPVGEGAARHELELQVIGVELMVLSSALLD
jgi:hypothetical protein